jgi:serine/threonine-protein kinase
MDTDRNLLFGVLALQADLIDQARFAEACTAWTARKDTPLADLLVERGWLSAEDRADVEKLLARKLSKHGGDARPALAEVTSDHVRRTLTLVSDPDVRKSLAGVPLPAKGHILLTTIDPVHQSRGRYTLSRLHATGGIGRVWLARDQSLGRDVALKELLPERASRSDLWARFLKEAQITGQLEHPGIVPIYEVGRHPDDQPFYTMRFVRGRTLLEAIEDYHRKRREGNAGPLELRELLTAFVGVCNAIGYAHSRGVLHRDLKPQNVILGDFGEVMVLDWGLARLFDEPEPDETARTHIETNTETSATMQGQALGTPAYMAPEQAEGRLDLFSPRTDVYGLGAILFEILAGQPPFMGDDTTTLLRRVIHSEPQAPRSLVTQTPPTLDAICLKALAKKPEGRYASAKALATDVERWMADEPVSAWREPLRVRAGRWVRKHRTVVATALAALSVAVVGLLAVAVVQAESRRRLAETNGQLETANTDLAQARDREAEGARRLAESNRQLEATNANLARARDRAERRVELALGAVENFRSAVDGNLDVKNRPENEALRKTLLQTPLAFYRKLRDDLREGKETTPEARSQLADAYFRLATLNRDVGSLADALSAYDEAASLLEPLTREMPAGQQASLRQRLALTLAERGDLQTSSRSQSAAAHESFLKARELLQARIGKEPDDAAARTLLARVLLGTSKLQARHGESGAALATLRESLSVLEEARRRAPDNVEAGILLCRTHLSLSDALLDLRGRVAEAQTAAEEGLRIAQGLARVRPDDPECQQQLTDAYDGLGSAYQAKGEQDKALEVYNKQLAAAEEMLKARPTFTRYKLDRVYALCNVASAQYYLGRYAEGLATLQKAQDLADSLVKEHPTGVQFKKALSMAWSRRAIPLNALGRVSEALEAIEKAAAIREEVTRADPNDVDALRETAGGYYNVGLLNRNAGRVEPALVAYAKSLQLRERLAREHPDEPRFALDTASTLGNIASVEFERRRHKEALSSYERAVEILQKLVADHPDNAEFLNYLIRARQNLAGTLTQLGLTEKALEILRAAQEPCERMAREHPGVVQYQDDLTNCWSQFGSTYLKAGRFDEAAAAYQSALDLQAKLVDANPANRDTRDRLVEYLKSRAQADEKRSHFADAAKGYRRAAEVCADTSDSSAEHFYNVACCHARLVSVAGKTGSGLSAADGKAEGDKAMQFLRRAFAAGFHDAEATRADDDLASLTQRDDFRKLLDEMATKAKPDGK